MPAIDAIKGRHEHLKSAWECFWRYRENTEWGEKLREEREKYETLLSEGAEALREVEGQIVQ